MFAITYENEVHQQWDSNYIFKTFDEAKGYLRDQGFVEKNRLFYRENYNWSKYLKAYISPRKIYNNQMK